MPRPNGGDWLEDELKSLRKEGVDVLVSHLEDHEVEDFFLGREGDLCRAAGIHFLSHPIPDHDVPRVQEETDRFIRELADRFRAGKSVVVHCHAGIGRSSTIAAGVLLTGGMELATVLERLAEARGFPVPETAEQMEWVAAYAARVSSTTAR